MYWMEKLENLESKGKLTPFALQFARSLARLVSVDDKDKELLNKVQLLAALVAHRASADVCVKLNVKKMLSEYIELDEGEEDVELPHWNEAELAQIPFIGSDTDSAKPLVLSNGRVYLGRFYHYEVEVAKKLKALREGKPLVEGASSKGLLKETEKFKVDASQITAINKALKNRLTVITGGPGTGKTTILCAILVALRRARSDLRILACAPTGKAQARMQEAVDAEFSTNICDDVRAATKGKDDKFPVTYGTIHRLLEPIGNGKFRRNAENPLDADLVVVDESSMADLKMFAKLLAALPDKALLILMGDKNQLSSVEEGAVLGDICTAWKGSDTVAELKVSHRFEPGSKIAEIKDAMLDGKPDKVVELLNDSKEGEQVVWMQKDGLMRQVEKVLKDRNASEYLTEKDPLEALEKFDNFRVLCAERRGPRGVETMNDWIRNFFKVDKYGRGYPILIRENNPTLNLYNGDILMCWPDKNETGVIKAWINSGGTAKSYSIKQLPEHSPAFAMTIHKSQGSGFKNVLMVLPENEKSPLLTRELIYTGLTRAKETCHIYASEAALRKAVETQTTRDSGLCDRLGESLS